MKRYLLDARSLEHPEPLERAIAIIRKLDSSNYLYMIHRMQPVPLLALAKEHNLNHLSICDDNEVWHILISRNTDIELKSLLHNVDTLIEEDRDVQQ